MKNIAILASGAGTNAENIYQYFQTNKNVSIKLILTNNHNAGIIRRAKRLNIETIIFSKDQFYKSNDVISILTDNKIDLIVLAGFLWLIPNSIIQAFPNKIINIHPALLPKYGGKGMYGMHVHKAIIENNETESGISIHLVNEKYDEGKILYQAKCKITPSDSPESLAEKIHSLEYKYFPEIINNFISDI